MDQPMSNPSAEPYFMECDTCRAKPGSPQLCAGCIHNRRMIGNLKSALAEAIVGIKRGRTLLKDAADHAVVDLGIVVGWSDKP